MDAGLNWYLNPNLQLSLNYHHVEVERLNPRRTGQPHAVRSRAATPPIGVEIGQDYDVVGLRTSRPPASAHIRSMIVPVPSPPPQHIAIRA